MFTAMFAERGFEETAGILRSLREFLIEKFGREDADKALHRIEWLDQTEIQPPATRPPAFVSPPREEDPTFGEDKDEAATDETGKSAAPAAD